MFIPIPVSPINIIGKLALIRKFINAILKKLSVVIASSLKIFLRSSLLKSLLKSFVEDKKREYKNKRIVLFFDEINTNKNVSGVLKEILVDRHLFGDELGENIIPIAACNPYKFKAENEKRFTSGLKHEKMKNDSSVDLIYKVEPLPESMFYFV